jgi:hypothetical protein
MVLHGAGREKAQTPSCSVIVIATAPDAARCTSAAFVSGDLGGRVLPIATSVIVMPSGIATAGAVVESQTRAMKAATRVSVRGGCRRKPFCPARTLN